jgi:hypothetical protein
MQVAENVEDMAINPAEIPNHEAAVELFIEYQTFIPLIESLTDLGLDVYASMRYIVLLYSEDSLLNVRPPIPLEERQIRALDMAGFKLNDGRPSEEVSLYLMTLQDRRVFEFIFEYLARQKKFVWQEIITLETRIMENQMLRLRPVDEKSGKDEMVAFEKKGALTKMYKEWYGSLKETYDDFYGDNENVRAIHRINRANMASLENLAF